MNAMIGSDIAGPSQVSRKIDVCLIATYYYPVFSGAGERFRRYAPGLRDRGIQLRIITINQDNAVQQETLNGVSILRFPFRSGSNSDIYSDSVPAHLLKEAINYFQKNDYWPDVVHVLTHTLQSAYGIWRVRLIHGVPCVNSITMMPFDAKTQREPLKFFISQWLKFQPFNLLVVGSETIASRMAKLGVSSKRIEIIPNGVDLNRFHPPESMEERTNIRQQLGLKSDGLIILFVGHISPRKGVDLLVAAWSEIARKCPKAHLVLVGPYEKNTQNNSIVSSDISYISKIEQLIKDSTAPERVSMIGKVPDVELYMRAADIFIFPSRREGVPNAVVEAMASGLPCILTPFDGLSPELGRPGRDYILSSHSSKSLAESAINILAHTELRTNLGQAARKYVEDHLNIEISLDRYALMYNRLANTTKKSKH